MAQTKAGLTWKAPPMAQMKARLILMAPAESAPGIRFYPVPAPPKAVPDIRYYPALALRRAVAAPEVPYYPAHATERALAPGCSRHLVEPSRTHS